MKTLLTHLPHTRRSYLSGFAVEEPLAHCHLAPALRPRHELRFVDLRWSRNWKRETRDFRPQAALVGVGTLTIGALDPTLRALHAQFPGIRILLFPEAEYGNSHVLERPQDFAHPLAEALAPNFYLYSLRKVLPAALAAMEKGQPLYEIPGLLLREETGGWKSTAPALNEYGDIGPADRTILGHFRGRYRFGGIGRMAHLFYSYGCHFKCRFCPMSKHDGSIVVRNLSDVMTELQEMTEPNVFLQDYEPFQAPEAMARLAQAIEKTGIRKNWYMMTRSDTAIEQEHLIRRWQKIGLRWLYLGLDGYSPERLTEIRKGNSVEKNVEGLRRMKALGLSVAAGFLVRSDFTREDFTTLREHVRQIRPPLFDFTVETPIVGTKLFDETLAQFTTRDWSLFDLGHAVLPTKLPHKEFYREMTKLHWMAGIRSLPAMLRHYPARDFARNWMAGMPALARSWRAANDHESPTSRA